MDTKNTGPWQTELSHLKERSWDVVLTLNIRETGDWIVQALEETGPFAAADICNLAGFLQVEAAVPKLRDWVRRDGWDRDGGLNISLGLAALEALGNIGTKEAFDALMESKVSFQARFSERIPASTTPRNFGEAIAAAIIGMQDAEPLIHRLEIQPTSDAEIRCWIACASALEVVAFEYPDIVEPLRERFFALLRRPEFQDSPHFCFIVSATSFLTPDEQIVELLFELATKSDDQQVKDEAMEGLARWGFLSRFEELVRRVGLEPTTNGAWRMAAERRLEYQEAFVVGLLYSSEPKHFAVVAADVLRHSDYRIGVQILQFLQKDIISPELLEALVFRVTSVNHQRQAETESIRILATVSPQLFIQEVPYSRVSDWHPVARSAVVEGYEEILTTSDSKEIRNITIDALVAYLTDPETDVRRVAARTLGQESQDILEVAIIKLCSSEEQRLFQYGVEATVFLENETLFNQLRVTAETHRESHIRLLFAEVIQERNRKRLAKMYLIRVEAAPSSDLLSAWHFAHALRFVGDDDTLRQLRLNAQDVRVARNKQAFLWALIKDVEGGWRDLQDKRKKRLAD